MDSTDTLVQFNGETVRLAKTIHGMKAGGSRPGGGGKSPPRQDCMRSGIGTSSSMSRQNKEL